MTHQLAPDWGDHTAADEYYQQGIRFSKYNTWGQSSWIGDCIQYGSETPQGGFQSGCRNRDAYIRKQEKDMGFYNAATVTGDKHVWSSPDARDIVKVNQGDNPWNKVPIQSCQQYGTDAYGKPQIACPIEFILHGKDWQAVNDATRYANKLSGGTPNPKIQENSGARVPCPKNYVWVENGGIEYTSPDGRIKNEPMLAAICAEHPEIYSSNNNPTAPCDNTPQRPCTTPSTDPTGIIPDQGGSSVPLPPVVGADCEAFLASWGLGHVLTCPLDNKLPDNNTPSGKTWWDNFNNAKEKEELDNVANKDADQLNYFHYQPSYFAIGAGIALGGAMYYGGYNPLTALGGPAAAIGVDAGKQYLFWKQYIIDEEYAKWEPVVVGGAITAAGFLGPSLLGGAIGIPGAAIGSLTLYTGLAGLAIGAGYVIWNEGLSVFSIL